MTTARFTHASIEDAYIPVDEADQSPRAKLFRAYNDSIQDRHLLPPAARIIDSADLDRLKLIEKITESDIEPVRNDRNRESSPIHRIIRERVPAPD